MKKDIGLLVLSALFLLFACGKKKSGENTEVSSCVNHTTYMPAWTKDAVIYEVNLRQYTKEGTIKAFMEELPRLDSLGVDILWFMPIHPISEKNRKGRMGSYYSIQDYEAVNPDLGSEADFKALVDEAHRRGLYVILDWVANHTGWDHPWLEKHPEWYSQDSSGQIIMPAGTDWSDVADLNYENQDMQESMIRALEYWVKEFDIDGYRCDMAGMVPTAFWERARKRLDALKPLFMLAEDESNLSLLEYAFEANYGWSMHHVMNAVAQGEEGVDAFDKYFAEHRDSMLEGRFSMHFITNHDENSWQGTEFERMGDAVEAFAAFSFTIPGMPLIYTGQEFGNRRQLKFFEKDIFTRDRPELQKFYQNMISLKKNNPALHNGAYGGDFQTIAIEGADRIYAFSRTKGGNTVVAIFNFSNKEAHFSLKNLSKEGSYRDYLKGEDLILSNQKQITLGPWAYLLYSSLD